MIRRRWLVVVVLAGFGGVIGGGGSARGDRVAWLDETWTVEEHTSTFEEATSSLWFNDTYVSFEADIPVDPAFDLITDWGDPDAPIIRGHRVTATLFRDFQVEGPDAGLVQLTAILSCWGEKLPWYQRVAANLEIGILSGGTRVDGLWLNVDHPGYGYDSDNEFQMLDMVLDPGEYTFRIAVEAEYQRWFTIYEGAPWMGGDANLWISGIEPYGGVPIPEPSSLALGAVGLVSLGLVRLGRRRAKVAAA